MSHRDSRVRLQLVCLQQCLRWLLAGIDWSAIRFRKDCHWTPQTLVAGALFWAWSDELTLVERFRTVRKLAIRLSSEQRQLARSYQAFTKILRRWTDELVLLAMVELWAMALYALIEADRAGTPPERLSFAKLLLAFRRMLRDYLHPTEPGARLGERLQYAIIDPYSRKRKASRNFPRKKQERQPGPPKIIRANQAQIQLSHQLTINQQKGLTA